MKFEFNHFNFNVQDLERSIKWYEAVLGLKEVKRNIAKDGRYIIVFLGDGVTDFRLELTWLRDHPEPYDLGEQEFHLAMVVEDYEAAYDHHKALDAIIYDNQAMNLYFLEDPDGYWIEILSKYR